MQIVVTASGRVKSVYGETINLASIGTLDIQRGSHVEPNQEGQWMADLSPVDGPLLGPFDNRSEALAAEVAWLHENWLLSNLD
ncbi:hypothetical protein CA51_13220 [Rosistilla oblonga]|uniref:hypothetical protein n=1 Tax=Rosistilla oblonga TaxID=2527990 RepID=UPI00118CD2EA|nr:hypothetical protein [Rosistilla oblonga]QDV11458.1 hypothetical protein CA51_13220 [Rosistilla oblonga]